ncbi:hypothetical protein [Streptomyces massasporeus]|uniref:hypothetical protein n=1 Tax=Streptomyces massasporeus TaxID=67324 RepID=UPI00368BD616
MSKNDDDFEFEALLSLEREGDEESEEVDTPLTEEQNSAIQKIESMGFQPRGQHKGTYEFSDRREKGGNNTRRFYVPGRSVRLDLLSQVAADLAKYSVHEEYSGVISQDGALVEYRVELPGVVPSRSIIQRRTWDFPALSCSHDFYPVVVETRDGTRNAGFHLTSPKGDVCVELSPISPVAGFLIGRGAPKTDYTLKILLSSPGTFDGNSKRAQEVADSALFELNVKHDFPLNLVPRERVRFTVDRLRRGARSSAIRFPGTAVPREVSALFSFAAEAADNPPFMFLSYYQVLEYYLPLTSRRDAFKRIRREIRDFSFDLASDASVLRILNTIERVKGANEEDQMKVLVSECVREDKLLEFFKAPDAMHHFSKKGPIAGVPIVNANAPNERISVQAAKRVYALRNRIVHAKDDPKYAETPQLLPRSSEAGSLGLDILLVRFLALETIIDTQN